MHRAAAVHRSLQFRFGYRLCRSFRSLSLEEIEKGCRNRRLSPSPPLSRNLRALTGGASLPSHGLHLRWDGFLRPLSRVPPDNAVLWPESFRGGCSFGVPSPRYRMKRQSPASPSARIRAATKNPSLQFGSTSGRERVCTAEII